MNPSARRSRGHALARSSRRRVRRPCFARDRVVQRADDGRFAVWTERLSDDGAAVRLIGELDLAALSALDAALRRIERWSVSSVLVDATRVGFADLSVMRRLAAAHRRLEALGGGLLVVNPPDSLLRLAGIFRELRLPVAR